MAFNLFVFRWGSKFDTPAKRKAGEMTAQALLAGLLENGDHPALVKASFTGFVADLRATFGEGDDAPFVIERYPRALCLQIGQRHVPHAVQKITRMAWKHEFSTVGE